MNNVEKFFKEIESNPSSPKAQAFKQQIYNEYKEKSLNLNKSLSATQREQLEFLKKANDEIKKDTEDNLRANDLKDLLLKIDNDSIVKNTAVPEKGIYKYLVELEMIVKFTKNEGLKNFVKELKENEINRTINEREIKK